MLRIFSTHRLFGFLLTGLMITSCGGGTSSNTPTTGSSSGTSNNTSGGGGRQGLTNGGSGGTTGTNPIIPIIRQNAQDTYADCARIGDPSLNCDLDLRGVP